MPTENLVLRTVYVDPDVDALLANEARGLNTSKAQLFRDYLAAGMRAVSQRPEVLTTAEPLSEAILILRTVMLAPEVDDRLRVEAFDTRTPKNDLIRRYVRIGMSLQ